MSASPGPGSTAAAPEPAGVIDNPGTPLASGAPAAHSPSVPDVESGDAPAVESDGEQPGSLEAAGSVKEPALQPAAPPPAQSLDQAKVHPVRRSRTEVVANLDKKWGCRRNAAVCMQEVVHDIMGNPTLGPDGARQWGRG